MNFGDKIMKFYFDMLNRRPNIALKMVNVINEALQNEPEEKAAFQALLSENNSETNNKDYKEIGREEVECDPEIIITNRLKRTMKTLKTNLDDSEFRKNGVKSNFRERIENVSREPYPITSTSSVNKSLKPDVSSTSSNKPSSSSSSLPSPAKKVKIENPSEDLLGVCNSVNSTSEESFDNISSLSSSTDSPSPEKVAMNWHIRRLIEKRAEMPSKRSVTEKDLEYHPTKCRDFPGTNNRTPKEELVRQKNSLAARVARTKNKKFNQQIDDEAVEIARTNLELKRNLAAKKARANAMLRQQGKPEVDFDELFKKYLENQRQQRGKEMEQSKGQ